MIGRMRTEPNEIRRIAYLLDEAAAATGLSRRTLERAIARGELPRKKVGTRSIILASDLVSFCGSEHRRLLAEALSNRSPFSLGGANA
jgi:excisionase family DNA binding protein